MTLQQHIETKYSGNVSAFARDVNICHIQVRRWLKYGCLWIDGQAWKQQSNIKYD